MKDEGHRDDLCDNVHAVRSPRDIRCLAGVYTLITSLVPQGRMCYDLFQFNKATLHICINAEVIECLFKFLVCISPVYSCSPDSGEQQQLDCCDSHERFRRLEVAHVDPLYRVRNAATV